MAELPLKSLRVLEFAGIGPGPFCGQLLADMGADVIVIDRPERTAVSLEHAVERRGKRSIVINLKDAAGRDLALDLVARADILIEGNRPGVMERLGLGPDICIARNPALIYGRMTGWGQVGPYAQMAGHDITYIAVTGALHAMGEAGHVPTPPLNLLGDFGGGALFLAMGLLAALHGARANGRGQVVDAAICDGVNAMMGMIHSWDAAGRWSVQRGANILDGAAPYYRCYEAADGRYVAVGAIEPQFLSALLKGLGIDPAHYGDQHDRTMHPRQTALLAACFKTRNMCDWAGHFAGTDACVAPVLTYAEAANDPHIAARQGLREIAGLTHPMPAPVFDNVAQTYDAVIPNDGGQSIEIMTEIGISCDAQSTLFTSGAVFAA